MVILQASAASALLVAIATISVSAKTLQVPLVITSSPPIVSSVAPSPIFPRTTRAGNGARWWTSGWRIFWAQPGTWIGIVIIQLVVFILVMLVLSTPKVDVASIVQSILTPTFGGGLMLGCAAIARGERLRVGHLFEGFKGARFYPLFMIGLLNAAFVIVMTLGAVAVFAGTAGLAGYSDWGRIMRGDLSTALAMLPAIGIGGALAILVWLTALVILTMLNWFAPALVVLKGQSALMALKLSLIACWRNLGAFAVYGLVGVALGLGILILAALPLAFGSGDWATAGMISIALLVILGLSAALIVGPVVYGSIYAGFADTLGGAEAPPASSMRFVPVGADSHIDDQRSA